MIRIKSAVLAVLFLVCAACARFENPIATADGPRFDDALAGHWVAESEDGTFEMNITRNGSEGRILTTETEAGEAPETDELRLVTARLEQQTFASVSGYESGSNWTLFRYELVAPDRLVIYLDDGKFWDEAVRNKLVPGKTDEAGKERSSTVTASSEQLSAFVLGYGSVIFKDQAGAEFRRK